MLALTSFYTATQQFDADGKPLAGGLLHTYISGTNTPVQTFTDNTGMTANSNPIVLDSSGYVDTSIWVDTGKTYRFVLTDSLGNPIPGHSTDGIKVMTSSGGGGVVAPVGEILFGTGSGSTSSNSFTYDVVDAQNFTLSFTDGDILTPTDGNFRITRHVSDTDTGSDMTFSQQVGPIESKEWFDLMYFTTPPGGIDYVPTVTIPGRLAPNEIYMWDGNEITEHDSNFRFIRYPSDVVGASSFEFQQFNPTSISWESSWRAYHDGITDTAQVQFPGSIWVQNIQGMNIVNTIQTSADSGMTTGAFSESPTSGDVTINLLSPKKARTSNSSLISTTETYITPAFTANSLSSGDAFRITLSGSCTNSSTYTSTFNIRMGLDGTTSDEILATITTVGGNSSSTAVPFRLTVDVTIREVGAPGTILISSALTNNANNGVLNAYSGVYNTLKTVTDTNTCNYLGVSYKSANASCSVTFYSAIVERII